MQANPVHCAASGSLCNPTETAVFELSCTGETAHSSVRLCDTTVSQLHGTCWVAVPQSRKVYNRQLAGPRTMSTTITRHCLSIRCLPMSQNRPTCWPSCMKRLAQEQPKPCTPYNLSWPRCCQTTAALCSLTGLHGTCTAGPYLSGKYNKTLFFSCRRWSPPRLHHAPAAVISGWKMMPCWGPSSHHQRDHSGCSATGGPSQVHHVLQSVHHLDVLDLVTNLPTQAETNAWS